MLTFINSQKFKNTFKIEEYACPMEEVLSLIRNQYYTKTSESTLIQL